MIYIYQVDSASIRAKKPLEALLLNLPKSMHDRALRYKREVDAYNFVLGRMLLKKGLLELGQVSKIDQIRFQEDGKPYLDSVHFNISHSDDLVVCAISEKSRIGIDVEKRKEIILQNFRPWFSNKEWEDINAGKNKKEKFYWYWTRKESVIKALGVNLSYLHKIELDTNQDFFIEGGKRWYLKKVDFGLEYTGAICSEEEIVLMKKN